MFFAGKEHALEEMLKILEVMVDSLVKCGCRVGRGEVEEARRRFREFFEWLREWSRRVLELCPKDATCLQNQFLQSLFQLAGGAIEEWDHALYPPSSQTLRSGGERV